MRTPFVGFGLALLSAHLVANSVSAQSPGVCPSTWTQQLPPSSPPYRDRTALVDAPGLNAVFLFGGAINNFPGETYFGDLWKWNGSSWSLLNPATQPTARSNTAIAYDSTRNRLFMYGGAFNRSGLAEAWVFNGTDWSNISTPGTTAPGPRQNHVMIYDPARDRFVLAGGSSSQDPTVAVYYTDTWEFNPAANTWAQIENTASSLPIRLTYDSARARPVGYGPVNVGGVDRSIIFEWTGATWLRRDQSPQPVARTNCGWAFDPVRQRAILFAGDSTNPFAALGDTWEFDGTAWLQSQTAATGPGAGSNQNFRDFVYLAYSSVNQAALHIMASTHPSAGSNNQTWLYVPARPPTINSHPGSANPPACNNAAFFVNLNIPVGSVGTLQWQRDGVNISDGPGGATPGGGTVTGSTANLPAAGAAVPVLLSINNVQPSDAGSYRLVITTPCGSTVVSNPGTLSVRPIPAISTPPQPVTTPVRTTASLSATLDIAPGVVGAFQWQRNGVNIVDGPGGAAPGGGSVTGAAGVLPDPATGVPLVLAIENVQLTDAGSYTLVITSSCGPMSAAPVPLVVTPLPTDDCGLAPTLSNGTYNFSVQDFGSVGPYENNRCGGAWGGFGADAWFRYTATCTGTLRIATCGSGFDTAIFLYPNAACPTAPGTLLSCADNECGTNAELLYPVTVGQSFLVRVGGFNFDSSLVNLTISCTSPPAFPSDHCADAPFIGVGSYSFSTVGADTDGLVESGGDSGAGGDCAIGGGFQIDHDRWFRVLVPCTGAFTISLCGSDFDTRLMVYPGTACPTQPGTYVGCGDNQCTLNARVGGNVTAGEIYLVRVGGANGAAGNVQLNLTCLSTPPTDSCANAPTLADGVYDFYTWDTTTDGPDEPGTCNNSWPGCDNDVWFRYTAPCTGTATISLCGSTFDTKMFVYPGTACPTAGGTTIACSDDACGTASESTISVTAGQSFLVRVGGMFGDSGPVHLTLSCTPGAACPADYNRDGFLNLDDLGDFITDYYTQPPIPGGVQPLAPQYPDQAVGYSTPCPSAPDAPAPYATDAYRVSGYRVGFSPDASNACPLSPEQNFPNLDNLGDFITAYYGSFGTPGC
jgi:hypothetical protein